MLDFSTCVVGEQSELTADALVSLRLNACCIICMFLFHFHNLKKIFQEYPAWVQNRPNVRCVPDLGPNCLQFMEQLQF